VQVHLPETDANVRLLERTLDALVAKRDVPFAWASVGRGWDGLASAMALSVNEAKPKTRFGGVNLRVLGQDGPKDGADALLWIGRAWLSDRGLADEQHERLVAPIASGKGRTVAREDGLVRVSVPRGGRAPSALGADLFEAVSRARELARRAVLRKRRA
jgi:hypothetical protein